MTKEELAEKFVKAGYAQEYIEHSDLEILGITRIPKTFKSKIGFTLHLGNWESFCAFVYEKVTGEPHPGCNLRGRGFRSQKYGRDVANAIRENITGNGTK